MKICLLGLDNLPVLVPAFAHHGIGGESVQQTLLARALARRGHEVGMVVRDLGQPDGMRLHGIRVFKAFDPQAGLPVLRFVHPRCTGLWRALARADAELYYTSCAGMELALVALFCAWAGRACVFRSASDSDCDPARLLVRHARDRWLYALGLRRSDAILVQSQQQARALRRHYGLDSCVAGMFVEPPPPPAVRDIDLLWVANLRALKRPDRVLRIARALPRLRVHLAGGALPGEQALFERCLREAAALPNVTFHGRLPPRQAAALFARARLFVNTSDVEGFPNTYLQAWTCGVPVVTLIDPDGVIAEQGLGRVVRGPEQLAAAVEALLSDPATLQAAARRCSAYVARSLDEERVLAPYLQTFESVLQRSAALRHA